jgi:phytoene dehydrogenase-like protein
LFLADDYRENFEAIVRLSLPRNPSLYMHAPRQLDPSMAPPGEETLIAIVPVGHLSANGAQDWASLRDEARRQVFRRLRLLGITDLEQHIKFEVSYNPLSWRRRYNLMRGATHGLCHNLGQLAYFRPHNRHPRYGNLYFTGASTHPGTGVPPLGLPPSASWTSGMRKAFRGPLNYCMAGTPAPDADANSGR